MRAAENSRLLQWLSALVPTYVQDMGGSGHHLVPLLLCPGVCKVRDEEMYDIGGAGSSRYKLRSFSVLSTLRLRCQIVPVGSPAWGQSHLSSTGPTTIARDVFGCFMNVGACTLASIECTQQCVKFWD